MQVLTKYLEVVGPAKYLRMFLYPSIKVSVLSSSWTCAVLKAKPTALPSRDLKLWSICFIFLTGYNYVLMYWIIFSSGCFTTSLNFAGFPCSHPLPDRRIGWGQHCCSRDCSPPHPLGWEAGTGLGRCFLVSIREVWTDRAIKGLGHCSNRYCVAEPQLKVYL